MAGFFCCRMTLPLWYPVGGLPPALPSRRALTVPCGGLARFAARLPCLWFDFLPPIPPTPFPGGEGEDFFVFLCKGLRPLHPQHLTACGTYSPCRCGTLWGACPRHPCIKPFAALIVFSAVVPGGELAPGVAVSAGVSGTLRGACPLYRPPTLPLVCLFAPYPPNPLPGGKGGFFVFLCKGLRPLHPRHLTACGTCRTCQAGAQRGACPGDTGSTCQSGIRQGLAFGIASSPQNRQRHFPMSGAGSQGEGGPGERNFGV